MTEEIGTIKQKIRTIIFDLSEVLLSGLLGMRDDLALRLGVSSDEIDFKIPELQLLFEGKISEDIFWTSLIKKYDWQVEKPELKRLVRANFKEIEGTIEIVRRLKNLGYAIGLFSVHAEEWIRFCEEKFRYGYLFDLTIYSFEIGICKPDKRAFEILLEILNVPAQQVLFIDDSPSNIEAASGIGMSAVLFESAIQLETRLRDMSILSC